MTMKDDRKSTALAAAAFSRSARTPGHPAFVRMLCTMAKESDTDMSMYYPSFTSSNPSACTLFL
jgi:hypothetical protein